MLTACGIETVPYLQQSFFYLLVATVLTACGIETFSATALAWRFTSLKLQQCLPLAVLKPRRITKDGNIIMLQQHLPLAVLKHLKVRTSVRSLLVATAPTACGIETL